MGPGLLALIPSVISIINKVIPDKSAAAKIQGEIMLMQAKGELSSIENEFNIAIRQLDANVEEAKSDSLFKSGWRPFVGWACSFSFILIFCLFPMIEMSFALFGKAVAMPKLDLSVAINLLMGLLGMGALRSYERIKGVSSK